MILFVGKKGQDGSFETEEFYSLKNLIYRGEIPYKGFRHSFRDAGYTAPNPNMPCDRKGTRNQSNRQKNIKNVYQARTSKGDER